MKHAMERALEFSRCSCHFQNAVLARDLFEAAHTGKLGKLKLPSENPFHHPADCPLGKHDIATAPQINACIISWSRNELLRQRRPDDDYVLFCDDDIVIPRDTIDRLLAHGKDIVAPLLTKRIDPPEPVMRVWVEELQNYGVTLQWPKNGKLLEIDAIGTGCVLLSRRVIEEVAMAFHPGQYKETGNGCWFEFLKNPRGDEWGEDISFFHKCRMLGFKIFCDTSLHGFHMGDYTYGPEDYFEHQDAVIKAGGLDKYRTAAEKQRMAAETAERQEPESAPVQQRDTDVETVDIFAPAGR